MHKTILTAKEEEKLEEHFHKSEIELIRLKAHAILLNAKNFSPEQIAIILFKDVRSIQRWMDDFKERRLASIFSGHEHNNNASKLTKEQKLEIANVLKEPVTSSSLLPSKFWSVDEIKSYVFANFGVVYESDRSYHFLLKLGNLTFKYPDAFNKKRDEIKIQERMEEIKKELPQLIGDPNWEVFCADETGLQEKSLVRRAWLQKNKKTIVKISMEHESQSYIGFLNQKDFKFNCFEINGGNQEEMLRTIKLLKKRYPKKKLCIVWDNAGFHKGKAITDELKVGGKLEDVYFINLPPYAPEYNPVEHIWNSSKNRLSKLLTADFKEIIQKFLVITDHQIFNYKI